MDKNSLSSSDINKLDDKLAKYLDSLTGAGSGMVKVAHPNGSMTNNTYKTYRSSFLTLGDMQIPDDYREIFKWCRYFFKFDSLIGASVRSLATFPVTDWILNDTENSDDAESENSDGDTEEPSETFKFYENMLNEIKLYNHMIEVGYDYFLYGNCIIFAEPGLKNVKRRNKETGEVYTKPEVVWKSIQRLDLTRVRIDRDPKTGEKVYYYDIPPDIKRVIRTQKPKEKYDKIPAIFKKAVENKGLVKLKSQYVYQLQMPSESGDNGLWATPPVTHAFKLLLYMNILRQAQEAIAHEHIIPKRIYFFQETNEFSPGMDFTDLAMDFSVELKKQLDDPNYQIISPFPIDQVEQNTIGKTLMLVPELEQIQESILAAMGIPREFLFGGLSYSGSTTSLRILENHFITYRTGLLEYINDFLIKRLAEIRGEWEAIDDDDRLVKVTLSELKMADDIQQKQLMMQLNEAGKIPDEVMYESAFGLDATKTIKQLQAERIRKINEQVEVQLAQMEATQKMQAIAEQNGWVQPPAPVNAAMVPEPAPGAIDPTQGAGQVMDAAGVDPNAPQGEDPSIGTSDSSQSSSGGGSSSSSSSKKDDKKDSKSDNKQSEGSDPGRKNRDAGAIAQQMAGMSEAQRANLINKLPPEQAKRALMFLHQMQQNQSTESVDMRPMPEQRPPRRTVGGV